MIITSSRPGEALEPTAFHQLNAALFRGEVPDILPTPAKSWVIGGDPSGRVMLRMDADILVQPLPADSEGLAVIRIWPGTECSPSPSLTSDNEGLHLATNLVLPGERANTRWSRLMGEEIRPNDPRGHMLVLLQVRSCAFFVDFDSRQHAGIVVIAADVRSSVGLVPPHRCEFKYL